MESFRKNEKNIILSLLLCGLIVCIGTSVAFFVSEVNFDGDGVTIDGDVADFVEVTYDAGNSAFNFLDAIPGSSATKDFSINVKPNSALDEVTYAIKFNIASNEFTYGTGHLEEIKYTLTDSSSSDKYEGYIPLGETSEVTLAKITKEGKADTVYNYTLKLEFLNINESQNQNTNKSLTGNIKVEFADK